MATCRIRGGRVQDCLCPGGQKIQSKVEGLALAAESPVSSYQKVKDLRWDAHRSVLES